VYVPIRDEKYFLPLEPLHQAVFPAIIPPGIAHNEGIIFLPLLINLHSGLSNIFKTDAARFTADS
jgi:hypothetical protein